MGSACCVHCRACCGGADDADDYREHNEDGDNSSDDSSGCPSGSTIVSNPRLHLHNATLPTVARVPQTTHPHDVPSQQPVEQLPDSRQAQLVLSRGSMVLDRGAALVERHSSGTDPFSLDSSAGTRRLSYASGASHQRTLSTNIDGTKINPLDIGNLTPRSRQRAIAKSKDDAKESHRQLLENAMRAINDAAAKANTARPPRVKTTTVLSPLTQSNGQSTQIFGEASHPPNSNDNSHHGPPSPDDEPLVSGTRRSSASPKQGDEFSMSSADSEQSLISAHSQHMAGGSTSGFIPAGNTNSEHRGYARMVEGKSRRASVAPRMASSVYNASASGLHSAMQTSSVLSRADPNDAIPENSILERSFDAGNVALAIGSPGALDADDAQNSSMLEASVRNSFDQYLMDHMMQVHKNAKVIWFRGTDLTRDVLPRRNIAARQQIHFEVAVAEVTGGSFAGGLNESRTSSLTISQASSSLAAAASPQLERQLSGNQHRQLYQTHVPSFPLPRKRTTEELSVLIETSVKHEDQLAKRLARATAFVYQI